MPDARAPASTPASTPTSSPGEAPLALLVFTLGGVGTREREQLYARLRARFGFERLARLDTSLPVPLPETTCVAPWRWGGDHAATVALRREVQAVMEETGDVKALVLAKVVDADFHHTLLDP